MSTEARQTGSSSLPEQEVQVRLTAVWVGIWMSVIVSAGCAAYALATWSTGPNRDLIVAATCLGLLSAPVIALLPIERVIRGPHSELFFIGWTAADIVLIGAIAALDGGSQSPYALILVLPILYSALNYPPRSMAVIGALAIVTFPVVALVGGGGRAYTAFGVFGLACVGMLGSWEARNQERRRLQLAETAEALRESERVSGLRTAQQMEVARFGQLALGGLEIKRLLNEAVAVIERVLDSDMAAVVRLEDDKGEKFAIVAQRGMSEELLKLTSSLSAASRGGYARAAEGPIVVTDWASEKRLRPSPVLEATGMRSGISVPIETDGEPWGVIGMQSSSPRDYSPEDQSFVQAIANVLSNAIERYGAEQRSLHEALHDPLTGLPNRSLFLDRLEHSLAQSQRSGSSVAVLFLDLDQFKLVNDSLGHAAGDELLAAVAPRLTQAIRPGDTVARFGGDEFAVLAEDISSERDATRVAERIAHALTAPFIVCRREHFASASIGIAIHSGREAPEELMRDADAALYRAKERGRGGYEIFDELMRSRVVDHLKTENDLRGAIGRSEFELHFQPIISLADDSVAMLEALLRWRHPVRGLLPPAAFIPAAEESRLIVPIGRWAIDEACRQAAAWQALDPDSAPVGVAVNLSARQLTDPELLRSIRASLDRSGIAPSCLRLELTETTLLEEFEAPELALRSLRSIGVRLVLDDFGTGFSSLGYLKRLPLAGIKLDRAFIENLTDGGDDAAIVGAVTEMARSLGLEVCAEGVETDEQLAAIRSLGCSHAQGFLLDAPAPVDVAVERLRSTAATV